MCSRSGCVPDLGDLCNLADFADFATFAVFAAFADLVTCLLGKMEGVDLGDRYDGL